LILSKRSRKAQVWIGNISAKGTIRVLMFKVVDLRGGDWHPVTGGVDENENFLEGAMRELEEETGFRRKDGKWVDLKHAYEFESRYGSAEEHSCLFVLDGKRRDPKLDPHEHLVFEWVEIHEAERRVRFDGQRNALRLVSAILNSE
jgi:8-oxo-dGTP pyrophosphatase MutT (NUDIX family)